MRVLEIIVFIVLWGALAFGGYLFWTNLPGEPVPFTPYSSNYSGPQALDGFEASGNIIQFYPNMRFKESRISYRLESACTQSKFQNIERAFSILSDKTDIEFYSTREEPEIKVLCSEIEMRAEEKGHFIAGEGGPSEIINTTNFAVILNGKMSLYRDEKCDEPKIAIHEILHVLGFDHYNNPKSILYPVTGCDQEIDDEIVELINKLYSVPSYPDLIIDRVSAIKSGRYLSFDINITNAGLQDSIGSTLNVYSDDDKAANFDIGELEIGTKKVISVQNVRVPSSSTIIRFEVDSDDKNEISLENNEAELKLA